jgi:tetratricopeptide (TPR) repeat protein
MLDNTHDAGPATQLSTVLFLAANPVAIQLLQISEECRAIEDKIRGAKFRDQLCFRSRWAARPADLLQCLHEDDPAVLHFSGHGAGAQGLCFLGEDGGVLCVSSDGLAKVVRAAGDSIKLIVLNACYTKIQAEALIAYVPCVIGMPDVIGDSAAITYASALYQALAFGSSIANAHHCGLAALAIHSTSGHTRDVDLADIALHTPIPELLTRTDANPNNIYIVQHPNTSTATASTPRGRRIHIEIDIDSDFETIDPEILARIVAEAYRLSGGQPIRIVCVTKGSVRLVLSFEPEAADVLMKLHGDGQLTQLCGLKVTNVVELAQVEIPAHAAVPTRPMSVRAESLLPGPQEIAAPASEDTHRIARPAKLLRQRGLQLRDHGELEPAIATTREALELYRVLASRDPEPFQSELASGLHDLGIMLRELGQYEPALAAAREAVDLRRRLAARNPDQAWPELAGSLSNLGNRLRDLGHHEQALAASREAVDLYRSLATVKPDRFRPDLARSLHNLSILLRELGQREPALVAIDTAVTLYRALVERAPDRFRHELAESLQHLDAVLRATRQHKPALAALDEAIGLYRMLATHDPDTHEPELARSLNDLGERLRKLGRRNAALTLACEAVGYYRSLAARNPDKFLPELADSLNNLGVDLSDLAQHESALAATREAIDLYRTLAASNPDEFQRDLERSVSNLGAIRSLQAPVPTPLRGNRLPPYPEQIPALPQGHEQTSAWKRSGRD